MEFRNCIKLQLIYIERRIFDLIFTASREAIWLTRQIEEIPFGGNKEVELHF